MAQEISIALKVLDKWAKKGAETAEAAVKMKDL
jgi:hypothetical protein